MRGYAVLISLVATALGGCPKGGPAGGGGTVAGPSADAERVCRAMNEPKLLVATGDPEKDLFKAFPGRVQLHGSWELGGAGGLQSILTGEAEVDGTRCAVLATVAEVKGKLGVMRVSSIPYRQATEFAGILDLAGCEQGIGNARPFEAVDARRLRAMAAPAVVIRQTDSVQVFRLARGRMTQVWEARPSYQTDNGSVNMINGIRVVPDERGMVARWEDVYHPRHHDGPPTSPVSNLNEDVLLAAGEWPEGARDQPAMKTRARIATALEVEPDALRDLVHTAHSSSDPDGWVFATFDRDGVSHGAVAEYARLTCGDLAVERVTPIGVATRITWAVRISLSSPDQVDLAAPANPEPLRPAEEGAADEDVYAWRDRARRPERDAPASPEPQLGFVIQTIDAAGTPTVHVMTDAHGVTWRAHAPLPARIELAMGTGPIAHLLVDGRVFRFDGTAHRPDSPADSPASPAPISPTTGAPPR